MKSDTYMIMKTCFEEHHCLSVAVVNNSIVGPERMTCNHREFWERCSIYYRSDRADFFCLFLFVCLMIFALAVAGLRSHDRGQVKGTRQTDTLAHT